MLARVSQVDVILLIFLCLYHIFIRQGSPEGPATGDFLRVLKHITPATNFGSILFLVQHFKCIFYRNKEAKQLVYFVRQTNILLTSISVL